MRHPLILYEDHYPLQLIMATATLTKPVKALLQEVEGSAFNINFAGKCEPNPFHSLSFIIYFNPWCVLFASDPGNLTPSKKAPKQSIKMDIVEVDGVHRTLPHVRHLFEDSKGTDKTIVLRNILERIAHNSKRTLVFCNTIESCRAIEYAINEDPRFHSICYHGDMNSKDREENLERFRKG
jgi:superfamily II DNA helicase RecQ